MKQKIAIIGTGLIGGSLGLALKQAKLDVEITGHDKNGGAAGLAKKRARWTRRTGTCTAPWMAPI